MAEDIKKTRIEEGYGNLVRQDLEKLIERVEGQELTDSEIKLAMKTFMDRFESLTHRITAGAAISRAVEAVTETEVLDTGKVTEIRFGQVPLASQMIMVAFD